MTRSLKLTLATAIALTIASTASFARTAEQEQLCTSDAFRLCSADIPNVDAVTACMIRNKAQLSAGCKSVFYPQASAAPASYQASSGKASKPINLVPAKPKRPGA